MGVKSILVALNANGIFGFGKSGPCPLHVCHVIQWINLPISSVWRSYFWLEQSVNSTASLWLSLWLDKLSLEKLLEILMYGLIVLESTVITWSVFCSTALRIKCGQLKNSEQLISPILEEHSHWNEEIVAHRIEITHDYTWLNFCKTWNNLFRVQFPALLGWTSTRGTIRYISFNSISCHCMKHV